MSIFNTFKQGQIYADTWPLHPKLGMIFPENRIIKATGFAQKFMPFIAVFALLWQQFYAKGDVMALAAAGLTAVFALCIPFQGLYWLGKRAGTTLPPQTAIWFYHICKALENSGEQVRIVNEKLNYQHLAEVLAKANKRLDDNFWHKI